MPDISKNKPYSFSSLYNKKIKFNKVNKDDKNNYKLLNYSETSKFRFKNNINKNEENKLEILNKDYFKIKSSKFRIVNYKTKIKNIKYNINRGISNKIKSNSFSKGTKSKYYYENTSNYFRHNSFFGYNLYSTKNNIKNIPNIIVVIVMLGLKFK